MAISDLKNHARTFQLFESLVNEKHHLIETTIRSSKTMNNLIAKLEEIPDFKSQMSQEELQFFTNLIDAINAIQATLVTVKNGP